MKRTIYSLILAMALALAAAATPAFAADADSDGDGFADQRETELGLPTNVKQEMVLIDESPPTTGRRAATGGPDIRAVRACHVGGDRLLFEFEFAQKPDFRSDILVVYLDMDVDPDTGRKEKSARGTDVMLMIVQSNCRVSPRNAAFDNRTKCLAVLDGRSLFVTMDAPLTTKGDAVTFGIHCLAQKGRDTSDVTTHKVVEVPYFADRPAPKVNMMVSSSLESLSDYRYHDKLVKLDKLENKGLTYEEVAPPEPYKFGRERPPVPFAMTARAPEKQDAVARRRVSVELLEEAGVARSEAPVTFGFPFAPGACHDLERVRVLGPDGAEVPAQVEATVFWPDDSLKWALIDIGAPLKPNEKTNYAVEFGGDVRRAVIDSPLNVTETDDAVTVMTGRLEAVIDKKRFNLLRDVKVDGKPTAVSAPEGVKMIGEKGTVYSTSAVPPTSVTIEEIGPKRVTVRVEGDYASADGERYQSYIARLTFRAGSPRATIEHTHVDTYLKTEFTDIQSLTMPFRTPSALRRGAVYLPGAKVDLAKYPVEFSGDKALEVFQLDESHVSLAPGAEPVAARAPGVATLEAGDATIGIVGHEFWQRWPKAIRAGGDAFSLDILPKQPGADYGKDFPHQLMYPFVEGFYRSKWGMAFSTRVTIDFAGEQSAAELAANANLPVVAVVPAEYHAETGAFGPVAAPRGEQFGAWDAYMDDMIEAHLKLKEANREYGYFNYGDWYGERVRNWGNNEYDTAHGFYCQFVRTGDRRYHRWALASARHDADVDCIHAYPDGYSVGVNWPHSIGHTGSVTHTITHGHWSQVYGRGSGDARNGHNWATGLADSWVLTGDARIMEVAQDMGEQIAWAMAPNFNELGSHERTAGWALRTIMAIYRATYDPVYLKAAKRIVSIPLKEQNWEKNGTWPHILPHQHAGGKHNVEGNNVFLIGVLLNGMKDYHEVTRDPEVEKSIVAGAQWIAKSYDAREQGWPYSASYKGEPVAGVYAHLNALIIEPLVYVAPLTGDKRLIEIAEDAFAGMLKENPPAFGKSVSFKAHFANTILGRLQRWYDANGSDKAESVLTADKFGLANTEAARSHKVRSPDRKVFWARLEGKNGSLRAERRPCGARPHSEPTGTVRVLDAGGRVVKEATFDTDKAFDFEAALSADAPGAVYRIVVQDDQRGAWSLFGEGAKVVAQLVPRFSINGVGRAKYFFDVPKGTKAFTVKLRGVHSGAYGAAVIAPDGSIAHKFAGINTGRTQLEWAPGGGDKAAELTGNARFAVEPTAGQTGKPWAVVLWAAGDVGVELAGVPPYLALSPDDLFRAE